MTGWRRIVMMRRICPEYLTKMGPNYLYLYIRTAMKINCVGLYNAYPTYHCLEEGYLISHACIHDDVKICCVIIILIIYTCDA